MEYMIFNPVTREYENTRFKRCSFCHKHNDISLYGKFNNGKIKNCCESCLSAQRKLKCNI